MKSKRCDRRIENLQLKNHRSFNSLTEFKAFDIYNLNKYFPFYLLKRKPNKKIKLRFIQRNTNENHLKAIQQFKIKPRIKGNYSFKMTKVFFVKHKIIWFEKPFFIEEK